MVVRTERPHWLRVPLPGSPRYHAIRMRRERLGLATVCEEGEVPEHRAVLGSGTATFLVLGDTCTRGCRFCAVATHRSPPPPDPDEPAHLAEAVDAMGLDYVVLTSVDRDDLPDGGAAHFARCIAAVKARRPDARVEVLIPDFGGDEGALATVLAAGPHVVGHNVETVERLTASVRDPRASWRLSLEVLAALGRLAPGRPTKSGLMLGLGEAHDEVIAALRALRGVGVSLVTLGQYLQPTRHHLEVAEYVTPDRFAEYERIGLEMGFLGVASGPLVRSSFRAADLVAQHFWARRP